MKTILPSIPTKTLETVVQVTVNIIILLPGEKYKILAWTAVLLQFSLLYPYAYYSTLKDETEQNWHRQSYLVDQQATASDLDLVLRLFRQKNLYRSIHLILRTIIIALTLLRAALLILFFLR